MTDKRADRTMTCCPMCRGKRYFSEGPLNATYMIPCDECNGWGEVPAISYKQTEHAVLALSEKENE